MSRKYPELNLTEGQYYVYCHTTPDGMYYIGMSQQPLWARWRPSQYEGISIYPYIQQYGWDNIKHTVLAVVDSKHEAETLEDEIICALAENGMCINRQRSGGHKRDKSERWHNEMLEHKKEYYQNNRAEIRGKQKEYRDEHLEEYKEYCKEYYEDHKDEMKQRAKKYYQENKEAVIEKSRVRRSTPEGKVYERVRAFNRRHPDLAVESPLEAKKRYLEQHIIPDYIRQDDL